MKLFGAVLLTLATLAPMKSFAVDTTSGSHCKAKEVEKYYCPTPGGWWYGPYYDAGCEVACSDGGKAVCTEASCDTFQTGQAIQSDCHCE